MELRLLVLEILVLNFSLSTCQVSLDSVRSRLIHRLPLCPFSCERMMRSFSCVIPTVRYYDGEVCRGCDINVCRIATQFEIGRQLIHLLEEGI
ncbi:hypothetical protein CHS0354_013716 [Potamilus streckersoni]|uniref:Uncharacterized protein n=1 Tax=Potamilus streckersoni TaxID=2493646 RepID=A0AAE0WCH4_9BIVA|nr:hypothetical protein CHS0354_013716 [Potamilus streckersoni]